MFLLYFKICYNITDKHNCFTRRFTIMDEQKKKDIFLAIAIVTILLAVGGYIAAQAVLSDRASYEEHQEDVVEYLDYQEEVEPTVLVIEPTEPTEPPDEYYEEYEEYIVVLEDREGLHDLYDQLNALIAGFGGEYSIYVKNLTTQEYMVINEKRCVPASLLKLFVMAAVFEQIEQGVLEQTPQIDTWLRNMIVVSCNDSHNHLLSALGNGYVLGGARFATDFSYEQGFTHTVVGGTLHPSHFSVVHFANLYTSVTDVGNLMKMIYRGELVSPHASEQMLDILLDQQLLGKIPAGLPPDVVSASKTGEIVGHEHDAAIVFSENADFVLVIKSRYDPGAISNIHTITATVYNYFNTQNVEDYDE